jgi:Heparinase II/III-like protein
MSGSSLVPHLALSSLAAVAAAVEMPPDPERVRTLAAMLPEKPTGVGRPLSDRAAWAELAARPAFRDVITRAEKLLAEPLPEQSDDLFLDYSRTGNRRRWEQVAFQRRGRVSTLALAECLEPPPASGYPARAAAGARGAGGGRFLPALEQLVEALCAERTWVFPAHDRSLSNFHGTGIDIDLFSSALAWNLATADWLLRDRLSAATRARIRENVSRRVLEPYRAMFTGRREPNAWMRTTNNWNAVCLAGVTGTVLAQIAGRGERAEFVAAAEKYCRNFLRGFTADGYCSEGLGYWNYGFGHFVLLAETIRQATGGGLDLCALPEVKAPAAFGARIQILGGVAPAFADCRVGVQPSTPLMWFLNRRFGLGLPETPEARESVSSLFEAGLYNFPNAASEAEPAGKTGGELRTWFEDAGVLISRPAAGSACRMGVALKGGHNAEHHNHNDVGSYVVVLGDRPVLLDPGAETYTARTFSDRRYESQLLNSFGHPVPVVAGRLQRTGREAQGEVLRTAFTEHADTLVLDLRAAYDCPELKTLERTFVYSRAGTGALTLTDRVEFTTPRTFATALLTRGRWQRLDDGALLLRDGDEALRVEIDAGGEAFDIQAEEIREDAPVQPTRLGLNLARPVTEARVTLRITPEQARD